MKYTLCLVAIIGFSLQASVDRRPDISKQGLLYFFSKSEAEEFALKVHKHYGMIDKNTLVQEAEGLYFRPGNDVGHFRWRHGTQAQYRILLEEYLSDKDILDLQASDAARSDFIKRVKR